MSTRITDLPQATELNGSEIMPLVQNGVTKKATLDFINLAAPAALILQQTQQVYQDTVDVKAAISKPDASLVGFQQAGTGAVVRTVQDTVRERVSVKDFGGLPRWRAGRRPQRGSAASCNGWPGFSAAAAGLR